MPKLKSMNVTQLKQLLVENGLPTEGVKAELVLRLQDVLESDEAQLPSSPPVDFQAQLDEIKKSITEILDLYKNISTNVSTVASAPTVGQTANVAATVPEVQRQEVAGGSSSLLDVSIPPLNETIATLAAHHIDNNNAFYYRYSVKEIAELIPEFNPTDESSLSVEQFIEAVERAKDAFNWNDNSILLAVYRRFKGAARSWLDASPSLFTTWREFSTALLDEFGSAMNEAEIGNKMQKTVRNEKEKVSEYVFRMGALRRRYQLSEAAVISYARDGLKHRELQSVLSATRFTSLKEFREACEIFFQNTTSERAFRSKGVETPKNVFKNEQKTDFKCELQQKRTIICYNCNEAGHLSSQCTKAPRRKRCTDCQRVHARGEPENCGKKIAVKRVKIDKKSDMFEKRVNIMGREFSAYLDTGSECNMIRQDCARALDVHPKPCHALLSGLWGGNCMAKEIIGVPVEIDGVVFKVSLYVVGNDTLPTDLLLGAELFTIPGVVTTIHEGVLKFSKPLTVMKTNYDVQRNEIKPITADALNFGLVNDETLTGLLNMINHYRDVFSENLTDLGKTTLLEMTIVLASERAIASKPYRIPEPKKPLVKTMINELLANDIIVKSSSEFASPMLLVKKKDGSDRLCVDYRQLNNHTAKEVFPMPNIEESLQEAAKFCYYVSLDLNSGFYQIPIAKNSRKYTAFITPDGLYEFKRMPFGLKNAPAVFQRLMFMLREKFPVDTMVYMDDILIGGQTVSEVLGKLEQILDVLRESRLTLNLKKCTFLTDTLEFLGHQLTPAGIEPGKIKTLAITNFPNPTNVSDVRRFLGLSGYFRKFVCRYAQIAEPLRDLLRKNQTFKWGDSQAKAFEQLKRVLTSQPVLTGFKVESEHEIHTDASAAGIAGVLLQRVDDHLKPVAYFSRSTTDCERRYHSYELETLAVVETLERFRYYIYGKPVKVVTDCNAVTSLKTKREIVPRIARWWLKIQDFDVELNHKVGTSMAHVDALSRAAVEESRETDVVDMRVAKVYITPDDWLFTMQMQDSKLQEIVQKLNDKNAEVANDYKVVQGRLFKIINGELLWVVPKGLRWKVTHDAHDRAGHLGLEKTIERLRTKFWYPRMRNFVKGYVKSCIECAYNKTKGGQTEAQYHYTDIEPVPFKTVHVDHLGPFPVSRKRNEHVLVIIDAFTKFIVVRAVKNTSTKFVIDALQELSGYVGVPTVLVSDRGTAFSSQEFQRYCKTNDIKHRLNAVRTPRANGQVERMNRTILSMLTTLTTENKQWEDNLRDIQWSLNTMKSSSTGRTPQQLLYNFTPRDVLKNRLILALHESNTISDEQLETQRREAADRFNEKRAQAKKRFDKQHRKPKPYVVGDLVLVESDFPSVGHSRKLEPKYKGPFLITKVLSTDRYVVEDIPATKRSKKHYTSIYSADKLKRWCDLPDDSDNDDDDGEDGDEDVQQ